MMDNLLFITNKEEAKQILLSFKISKQKMLDICEDNLHKAHNLITQLTLSGHSDNDSEILRLSNAAGFWETMGYEVLKIHI